MRTKILMYLEETRFFKQCCLDCTSRVRAKVYTKYCLATWTVSIVSWFFMRKIEKGLEMSTQVTDTDISNYR